MDFHVEDYIRLYWVAYYHVKSEYCPEDKNDFPERSPKLWEWTSPKEQVPLGRLLFNRSIKYIYLITTYYCERKTDTIQVDDAFLILVFNRIGCKITLKERKTRALKGEDIPPAQHSLFKQRYSIFSKEYPDLEHSVAKHLNKILEKLKQKGVKVNPAPCNNNIGQGQIEEKRDARRDVQSIVQAKHLHEEQLDVSEISELLVSYFKYLGIHDYYGAFEHWHPQMKSKNWVNNSIAFSSQFLNLPYINLKSLKIWDVTIHKHLNFKKFATCKVSFDATYTVHTSIEKIELLNCKINEIDKFKSLMDVLMERATHNSLAGFNELTIKQFLADNFTDALISKEHTKVDLIYKMFPDTDKVYKTFQFMYLFRLVEEDTQIGPVTCWKIYDTSKKVIGNIEISDDVFSNSDYR